MLKTFELLAASAQIELEQEPYDYWVTPEGNIAAEFYRTEDGFLLRFPGEADFYIEKDGLSVSCAPVPQTPDDLPTTLFKNSIRPVLGNHLGGLNLHGSGVAIGNSAVAFVGPSRRGKTTLAGAFASSGFPCLTEDVIKLESSGNSFTLIPQEPHLRLFRDSAEFLLGKKHKDAETGDEKVLLDETSALEFSCEERPLRCIFFLGDCETDDVEIRPINQAAAIAELLQQSFVLDVEDQDRLRDHFLRLSRLAKSVPCYELDYPREFKRLNDVTSVVAKHIDVLERSDL